MVRRPLLLNTNSALTRCCHTCVSCKWVFPKELLIRGCLELFLRYFISIMWCRTNRATSKRFLSCDFTRTFICISVYQCFPNECTLYWQHALFVPYRWQWLEHLQSTFQDSFAYRKNVFELKFILLYQNYGYLRCPRVISRFYIRIYIHILTRTIVI